MSTATEETTVRFEGLTEGTDVWAATTADFLVQRPGHNAKEASVMLTDAGAAYLAGLLGQPDSATFRRQAATEVGQLWMERVARQGRPIESIVQLARNILERDREFLDEVRAISGRFQAEPEGTGEPEAAAHGA